MELKGKEIVTVYHVATYAGRVRVYDCKATVYDSYGEVYYILTESHNYLGEIGNRLYKDGNTSADKMEIYAAAIKKTKKLINGSMDNIRKATESLRLFERIIHAS